MWVASRRGRLSCSSNTILESWGEECWELVLWARVVSSSERVLVSFCLGSSLDACFAMALSVDSC